MTDKLSAGIAEIAAQRMSLRQGIFFVFAYVALDWVSDLHGLHGLNIDPWNPSLALGLVYWLRHGRLTAIPWFIALLLAEIAVRGLPASVPMTVVISGGLVAGYGVMAEFMRRGLIAGELFGDQPHLLYWLGIAIVGTLTTSVFYISMLLFAGLIPMGDWVVALVQFWVGDFVGIIVTMPFFSMLFEHPARLREALLRWETLGYGALAIVMLWIAFGIGGTAEFQYFYLLFPPIVWAAARQGMIGACVAAFLVQAGIIVAARWLNLIPVTVFQLQMLGAVLAFVGFFIGIVVDEKQRVSRELRQTLRLAAAGEMASALAHELNQPLTALSAYGSATELLLNQGETGSRLREAVQCMITESLRAADVVRRLRDFFRTGATKLERVELAEVIQSAAILFLAKAHQQNIELAIDPIPPCALMADRLQLEVVIRNLLSNAFDAIAELPAGERHVRILFHHDGAEQIMVKVEDSGAGLSEQMARQVFDAFKSSKASGLGLGLAISRAIVQAHGGQLWAEPVGYGQLVLMLPIDRENHDAI